MLPIQEPEPVLLSQIFTEDDWKLQKSWKRHIPDGTLYDPGLRGNPYRDQTTLRLRFYSVEYFLHGFLALP